MSDDEFSDLDLNQTEEFYGQDDDPRIVQAHQANGQNLSTILEFSEDTSTEAETNKPPENVHVGEVSIDYHQGNGGQSDEESDEDFDDENFANGSQALRRIGNHDEFRKNNPIPKDDPRFNQPYDKKENSWEPTPPSINVSDRVTPQKRNRINISGTSGAEPFSPTTVLPTRVATLRSKNHSLIRSPEKSFLSPDSFMVNKMMSTPRTIVKGRRMDPNSLTNNLVQQFQDLSAIQFRPLIENNVDPIHDVSVAQSTLASLSESGLDRIIKETSINTPFNEVEAHIQTLRKREQRKKVDFGQILPRHSKTIASTLQFEDRRKSLEEQSASAPRQIQGEFETRDSSAPRQVLQEAKFLNVKPQRGVEGKPIHQQTKLHKSSSLASSVCSSSTTAGYARNTLSMKPSTLQFGFVEMNTAATLRLTIRNSSNESVEIEPSLKRGTPEFRLNDSKRILKADESYDLDVTFNPVSKNGRSVGRLSFYDSIQIKVPRPEPMVYRIAINACSKVAHLRINSFPEQAPLSIRKNGDYILKVPNLEQFSFTLSAAQRAAFAVVDVIDVSENQLECEITPSKTMLLQKNENYNVRVQISDTSFRATSSLSSSRSSINTISDGPTFFVRIVWAELIALQRAIIYAKVKGKSIVVNGIGSILEQFHGAETAYDPPKEWPISSSDIELLKRSLRSTKVFISTDRIVSRTPSVLDLSVNQTVRPKDLNETFNSTCGNRTIFDPDATLTIKEGFSTHRFK